METITPEQSQAALLNILDDMEESKEWLGDQQAATLNMMEDLVTQQEELKSSRQQFQDLNSMLAALSTKTSTKGALDFLAWSLRTIARFKKIVILAPASPKNLKVVSSGGFPKGWPLDKIIVSLEEKNELLAHAYSTGTFFAVDNVRSSGVRLDKEVVEMLTLTSILLMPVSMGAEKKVLVIADRGELLPFSPEEETVFKTFTSQTEGVLSKINLVGVLEEQREKLLEIDKMKTEFVSVASHQLRTPLTAIKLFIEMLSDEQVGKLNDKQREYMGDVSASTNRMIKLVNELLNVSRLETGRLKIEPVPTDLIKFIQSVVDDAMPLAKEKMCKLKFKYPKGKLPKLPIDHALMRQVVHNLIVNAIHYSSFGTDEVLVNLEKSGKKDYLLSVQDEGIGIPKKAQGRIFEKFFRADNAFLVSAEGSGLGLYVSKMVVDAYSGRIWFESEEDKGTTFYVTIPLIGMQEKAGEKGLEKI